MSYALASSEPVSEGVRRIALEQADEALAGLRAAADEGRSGADERIHDARKRFKKIRAVLRLVRKELGDGLYSRENEAWRDAGRLLAGVRESSVAPETVERLADRYGDVLSGEPFAFFRTRLEARHLRRLDEALEEDGALARATAMAQEARDRIDGWTLEEEGFDAIAASLRKVYRRGRKRRGDAYDDPGGERFHEWRKRAKYLWYHLRILTPSWPKVLEPWADTQHDLTDLLGDGNDLTDLLALLEEEPELVPEPRVTEVLAGLARERRRELWRAARPLGRRLYAESPGAFVGRMERYFEAARACG